jgi:putative membrane protein
MAENTSSSDAVSTDTDAEHEPDYRFTLANERTFLAWLRTSLALLAAGVAVVQLVPFPLPALRTITGGLLTALSVTTAVAGVRRWQRVENAIRHGRPLPRQHVPWFLAGGLVLLALLGLTLVVLRGQAP